MQIILLTHERELGKRTNTGALIADTMGAAVEVIVWQRTYPPSLLLDKIKQGRTALLYPSKACVTATATDDFDCYVVIDGTWQEARKIFNRSPYLHGLPALRIHTDVPSSYNLRRNQQEGCLCTAECIIELLSLKGLDEHSLKLRKQYDSFLSGIEKH